MCLINSQNRLVFNLSLHTKDISIWIFNQMVKIQCLPDGGCPYLWSCGSDNQCIHDPVFPATLYPILIYCLFPIASAICNTSGNSFGEFKVLLLMDLLDYTQSAATVLTYPLNVGTSLFNYVTLIFRRHPTKDTSLVDYNIILIIIPSVLYGSTIGALVNKFIPPIVADCIIMVLLGAFSFKFFNRFYNYRKQAKLQIDLSQKMKQLQDITKVRQDQDQSNRNSILQKKLMDETPITKLRKDTQQQDQTKAQYNQYKKQLEQQLRYQSTNHVPHILMTFAIFVVFETLSFLAQGKIIPFTICSQSYKIGVSVLTVVFIGIIALLYLFTKKKMIYYRRIKYNYSYRLDEIKYFLFIVAASFLGGFNGGAFGLGSSTAMIFALLFLGIEPTVVTATVGYQILFSNSASLLEAFITNEILLSDAGFFIGLTLIGGGILSYISLRLIKRLNQNRTNQVLMLIVGCLTGSSVLALIVNIILSYKNFGRNFMDSSPFSC